MIELSLGLLFMFAVGYTLSRHSSEECDLEQRMLKLTSLFAPKS